MKSKVDFVIGTIEAAKEYIGSIDDFSTRGALDALAHVKKARRKMKGLELLLEDVAIAAMHHAELENFDGDGYTAKLHPGGFRKKWRHTALVEDMTARIIKQRIKQYPSVDPEILARIVKQDIVLAYSVCRPDWRSTVLRRLGIEANDYSTKGPGQQSIEITGQATYDETNPNYREEATL
jgi:hypothetical protein